MGSAKLAHINPEMIKWALKKRGLTPTEIATKQLTVEQIEAWQDNRARPTHAQAEVLARKLRIPFLVLFLSEGPELELEIPDLRTVSGKPDVKPSAEFMQVVNDALVRQDWYRSVQQSLGGKPLTFVGSFADKMDAIRVANDIRATLTIDRLREGASSWKEFLNELIEATERTGILVFRSAVVGHATNKKLLVDEFRGFVLSDSLAPMIYINDDDAKAAQTFTLIHELAHIWIGTTGVSDPNLKKRSADLVNSTERFCNQVAAEVLVPADDFSEAWDPTAPLFRNLRRLTIRYRVSSLVILIRAHELKKLSEPVFSSKFDSEMGRFRLQDKKTKLEGKPKSRKQAGDFWRTFVLRNSKKFTDVVVTSTREGRARYTEAASLLGIGSATLENYLRRLQKAR